MKSISIALAVYNEESTLSSCLASVNGWVNEIILVDGGSRDRTVEIAKQFGAKVIVTDNPKIFHINKQKALNACSKNWILQLDADEVVPERLRDEIRTTIEKKDAKDGYYISRKNFFCGSWLRKGGQYPDYVIRLFKSGKGSFPSLSVHEQIQIDGSVGYLQEALIHNSYRTIADYWLKASRYTSLTASMLSRTKENEAHRFFNFMMFKPFITFFLIFIRHKGMLDGWYGFLFAFFSALHYPISYLKYRGIIGS